MEYLILASLALITIILTIKMINGLKVYNRDLRLQARADYYQARIERSVKTFHTK